MRHIYLCVGGHSSLMKKPLTVGLLGFGHIAKYLYNKINTDSRFNLRYVYVRNLKKELPEELQITDPSRLENIPVDLCIEAATHEVVGSLGKNVLSTSDLMVLSCSALAFPEIEIQIVESAKKHHHNIWIPHGALLGIDGLLDSQTMLKKVSIISTKSPENLDFSFTDDTPKSPISNPTVLYDGPTRGLAQMFPRNFNSHVAVALASMGLDKTTSKLIADPNTDVGRHIITAIGEGFQFEITRDSLMTGVTGDYTLFSTWGSIQRVMEKKTGIKFI